MTKAICSLVVFRDAMIQGMVVDDRPPKVDVAEHRKYLQKLVDEIFERHPDALDAFTYVGGCNASENTDES